MEVITIISNKIRASEEQKSRRAQPGLTSESLVRATQGVLSRDVTDVGRLGRLNNYELLYWTV